MENRGFKLSQGCDSGCLMYNPSTPDTCTTITLRPHSFLYSLSLSSSLPAPLGIKSVWTGGVWKFRPWDSASARRIYSERRTDCWLLRGWVLWLWGLVWYIYGLASVTQSIALYQPECSRCPQCFMAMIMELLWTLVSWNLSRLGFLFEKLHKQGRIVMMMMMTAMTTTTVMMMK